MGVQNGGQWSGLRRRGAPVKTRWESDGGRDRRPASGYGRPRPVVGRSQTIGQHLRNLLFPIEVTASAGDNYPAHNRPIFWQLLVSILGSGEIPFSG